MKRASTRHLALKTVLSLLLGAAIVLLLPIVVCDESGIRRCQGAACAAPSVCKIGVVGQKLLAGAIPRDVLLLYIGTAIAVFILLAALHELADWIRRKRAMDTQNGSPVT